MNEMKTYNECYSEVWHEDALKHAELAAKLYAAERLKGVGDKLFTMDDMRKCFNRGRLFQATSCVPFNKKAAKETFEEYIRTYPLRHARRIHRKRNRKTLRKIS